MAQNYNPLLIEISTEIKLLDGDFEKNEDRKLKEILQLVLHLRLGLPLTVMYFNIRSFLLVP